MKIFRMISAALFGFALHVSAFAAEPVVTMAIMVVDEGKPLPLSRLDLPVDGLAVDGARVAAEDNATTGRFMGLEYSLAEALTTPEEAVAEMQRLAAEGVRFFAVDASGDTVLKLADAAADLDVLLFNVSARDDRLRLGDCRANVMHIAPSNAMITDALAQYLIWKKWREWFLIYGSHPVDTALADAYRRAAKRFGAKITEERLYEDTGGSRRTDTGHVRVQKQMPIFTQRADDHDVVVTADASEVFGAYLPFRTWDPRPVAGSAGLRPLTWHPGHEAWGATQMQRRFERVAGRWMTEVDYQAWLAVRVIGEAATRTKSGDVDKILAYMRSADFEIAAFKGEKLTFRDWNNQLRQPILLAADKLIVSASPQEEFLHQTSRLDTLGYDRPESPCDLK